jgi:HK97 family phage major capsid protein
MTVTAAGAATVTFADIETLVAAVPANYRHGGGAAFVMAPAAYLALRNQKASTGGSYMWDPTQGDTLFGFPVRVDNALAAPASAARSVVFGDFAQAYAIRLLPVRFMTSEQQAFSSGLVGAQVVIRADGRTMNTGAVRALIHP